MQRALSQIQVCFVDNFKNPGDGEVVVVAGRRVIRMSFQDRRGCGCGIQIIANL